MHERTALLDLERKIGASFPLTNEQRDVVQASPEARLLIDAAAGTGKTAVACARVAHLIEEYGVEPTNIWLISFTRPAVAEIRKRIFDYVGPRAYSIKIATLDQQAFQIVQGFEAPSDKRLFRGYDYTIESAIGLVSNAKSEIREAIGFLEHLLIDESQDVVGKRADLILEVLRLLNPECGVSVFFDPAQAIYHFSEPALERFTLPDLIRSSKSLKFLDKVLTKIHRTNSTNLLSIFQQTRVTVLSARLPGASKLSKVKEDILKFADSSLGKDILDGIASRDDLLVLFRTKGEVLKTSALLSAADTNHRVRISNTPACVHPWVALMFWDFTDRLLTKSTFDALVVQRLGISVMDTRTEEMWSMLKRAAADGKEVVNMHQLRRVLSRPRPPIEFASPDIGTTGPIIGTIHASKGREAPEVHLHFNDTDNRDSGLDEEASVLFVGATRARTSLKIGDGFPWMRTLPSNRAFHIDFSKRNPACIEIGMAGDLDPLGQASQSLYHDSKHVCHSQEVLASLCGSIFKLSANTDKTRNYTFRLIHNEEVVGHLNQQVNADLFEVGKKMNGKTRQKPGTTIYDIWSLGCRSLVLSVENTGLQTLFPPFNESGIMLAPVICAFPTVKFFSYGGKR